MPEDGIKCESFTVRSIDFLLVYKNKYYLQVYFIDYLENNIFESNENKF